MAWRRRREILISSQRQTLGAELFHPFVEQFEAHRQFHVELAMSFHDPQPRECWALVVARAAADQAPVGCFSQLERFAVPPVLALRRLHVEMAIGADLRDKAVPKKIWGQGSHVDGVDAAAVPF